MSISRQRKKRKSGKRDRPRKRKRKRKKRKLPNGRVLSKHLSTARIDLLPVCFVFLILPYSKEAQTLNSCQFPPLLRK